MNLRTLSPQCTFPLLTTFWLSWNVLYTQNICNHRITTSQRNAQYSVSEEGMAGVAAEVQPRENRESVSVGCGRRGGRAAWEQVEGEGSVD